MIYQVKDPEGNVVHEFPSENPGPFTVDEKNDDIGGGGGPAEPA